MVVEVVVQLLQGEDTERALSIVYMQHLFIDPNAWSTT